MSKPPPGPPGVEPDSPWPRSGPTIPLTSNERYELDELGQIISNMGVHTSLGGNHEVQVLVNRWFELWKRVRGDN